MVGGLDKFRERLARFSDNFVIIGGTACDEVLRDTEMRPRATMDIDIVVIIENMTVEFATAFGRLLPKEVTVPVSGKINLTRPNMSSTALTTVSPDFLLR